MKEKKAIFSKILLYRKATSSEILQCEGQKSYIAQDFDMLRTEKLHFVRFCYVKDRKATFSKILLCEGQKSYI